MARVRDISWRATALGVFLTACALAGARPAAALTYTAIDLHPSGFTDSVAYGVGGGQQVGEGFMSNFSEHALLWTGTAASVVDLNPSGFTGSRALGASGGQQVGYGLGPDHALLWTGTAATAVDLNPSGFDISAAFGVAGGQQVGWGFLHATGAEHALLWSGTAASVVDLHPSGFTESEAFGVAGGQQVGDGRGLLRAATSTPSSGRARPRAPWT